MYSDDEISRWFAKQENGKRLNETRNVDRRVEGGGRKGGESEAAVTDLPRVTIASYLYEEAGKKKKILLAEG